MDNGNMVGAFPLCLFTTFTASFSMTFQCDSTVKV